MEQKIFEFSKEVYKSRQERDNVLKFLLPLCLIIMFIIDKRFIAYPPLIKIISFAATLLLAELILFIMPILMQKEFKKRRYIITNDSLERRDGITSEKVYFKDITGVDLINRGNKLISIELHYLDRNLKISMVENLKDISAILKNKIIPGTNIISTERKIMSNYSLVLQCVVLTVFLVAFYNTFGMTKLMDNLIPLLGGIFMISSKPFSKRLGNRYGGIKKILGYGLLILVFIKILL